MLVLLSVSLSAATYHIGYEGGVTLNSVIAGKGYRDYKYSMGVGYKASIPFVVEFNDNLGLETGLSLYGKYYKYSQTVAISSDNKQTNFDYEVRNDFIIFPLCVRFTLPVSDFELYTTLGGYMGVWGHGNRSGSVININEKKESVSEETDLSLYNMFDAGLRATLGAGVNFGPFLGYLQGEYSFSLTDMNKWQRHGAYHIHNSSFVISLGLLLRVK